MHKHMLWRDIFLTFRKSRGRFLSIAALLALGAFALVGLKVSGPDMRATSAHYFEDTHFADVSVIGDMGLDSDDEALISQASDVKTIEYGYLKDCTISDSTDAVRVWSKPDQLSMCEVEQGRLPETTDEIAIDSKLAANHPLGSTLSCDEKYDVGQTTSTLKTHTFSVVGIVNSPEIITTIMRGATQSGSGSLSGYAVVTPETFDVDYYMVARIAYNDTSGLDPYSQTYLDDVAAHKQELQDLLRDRPQQRLATVRKQYQDGLDKGQTQIDEAQTKLSDTKSQLDDAAAKIADAQDQIANSQGQLDDAAAQLARGRDQLDSAWNELAAGKKTLNRTRQTLDASASRLAQASDQLAQGCSELSAQQTRYSDGVAQLKQAAQQAQQSAADAQAKIDSSRQKLKAGKASYDAAVSDLQQRTDTAHAQLTQVAQGITQAQTTRDALTQQLAALNPADPDCATQRAQIEQQLQTVQTSLEALQQQHTQLQAAVPQLEAGLAQAQAARETFLTTDAGSSSSGPDGGYTALIGQADAAQRALDEQVAAGKQQLADKQAQLDDAQQQLAAGQQTLDKNQATYDAGKTAYSDGVSQYQAGLATYRDNLDAWTSASELLQQKTGDYEQGAARIEQARQELATKTSEYSDGLAAYEAARPDAESKIAEGTDKLTTTRETMNKLETPAYNVYNRREAPGSDGYRTYDSVSEIVDSLANIFPYFLYLVAALVASTTMTRMVDEERVGVGTLKALGYHDTDVMKKFIVYGAAAAVLGTLVGAILGHTLLPYIVYAAYKSSFTLPPLELHFHGGVSLLCLVLALVVTVIPAWAVAHHELTEKPASLLLPKVPSAGSKVLLERIPFIWKHLSFMRKVTARNLFRYKKRAAMTIFGVAGAVAILFAGLSVQNSISGIATRQFGDIIGYDLIVAKNAHVSPDEQTQIDDVLSSDTVSARVGVTYESITKQAGVKNDDQDISLLVPEDVDEFSKYVHMRNRESGQDLPLEDGGALISERLATLSGVHVGDTITFKDATNTERSVRVSGICEMYMNHFMVMNKTTYQQVFSAPAQQNAYVVTLYDGSADATRAMAAKFMEQPGVKGVVQSTVLVDAIDVTVSALNRIMGVLTIVAVMLAVVILYNLVTINVSERMSELSTIKVLGFYNHEVSMYIYRETIVLSILGVPLGWLFGRFLQLYIITAVPPENIMFDPNPGWICFAASAVLIAVVVYALYFVVTRRLRHVDMLEALKSVD